VHRNIGNLVPGNDLNVLSVLEYAVGHLHINDIIVTGWSVVLEIDYSLYIRCCFLHRSL
jgi:hypothetical protein